VIHKKTAETLFQLSKSENMDFRIRLVFRY